MTAPQPGLSALLRRVAIAVAGVGALLAASACHGDTPVPAKDKAAGPTVAGEAFTVRMLVDQQQGNIPVGAVIVPAKWQFESKITWKYENTENPVTLTFSATNPDNEEQLTGFGNYACFDLRGAASGGLRAGQVMGGLIYGHPTDAFDTLVSFIKRARAKMPKLQFVGGKDLPDLPKELKSTYPNQRGVGVKVTYELNGKPVEEEFYGVYYRNDVPYDGPQGRTYQTYWGISTLHSFRAAAGTLDKRRPVFAAIIKSFKPNPAWVERVKVINKYIADQFNAQLKLGYDRIAAAGAMSRAISANNDAMLANIDSQLRASSAASTPGVDATTTDKFSDYIRGVDTTNDPYYGTSQHSYNDQFHWTDGYGNYKNSNSATYDPNQSEVGNWTLLKNIR